MGHTEKSIYEAMKSETVLQFETPVIDKFDYIHVMFEV